MACRVEIGHLSSRESDIPLDESAVEETGLICAFQIQDDGRARSLDLKQVTSSVEHEGWTWAHFDIGDASTRQWIEQASQLEAHVAEALLSEETRPRATRYSNGTLIILRGVNLQPDSEPTDMISIRLWVENNRVISTRIRRLLSVRTLRERCEADDAPPSVGAFVVDLNIGLIERMSGVIQTLEDEIDAMETAALSETPSAIRLRLAAERQKIIPLRRFLSPQRDALSQILSSNASWLNDEQRGRLRECADRLTRYIEELDAMREKAAVIQDSMTTLLAERMNRTMLVLSIVAAIFLPLGLLTGLLGINVGGIPGTESPYAFWIVVLLLIVIGAGQIWLFRKLGLIDWDGHR